MRLQCAPLTVIKRSYLSSVLYVGSVLKMYRGKISRLSYLLCYFSIDNFHWSRGVESHSSSWRIDRSRKTSTPFRICLRMQRGCTDVMSNICADCKDAWGILLHRTPVRWHKHSQTVLFIDHDAIRLCFVQKSRIISRLIVTRLFRCFIQFFLQDTIFKNMV